MIDLYNSVMTTFHITWVWYLIASVFNILFFTYIAYQEGTLPVWAAAILLTVLLVPPVCLLWAGFSILFVTALVVSNADFWSYNLWERKND